MRKTTIAEKLQEECGYEVRHIDVYDHDELLNLLHMARRNNGR